jgi:hypothetical protein
LFVEAKEEIEKALTDFTSPAGSPSDASPITGDEQIDSKLQVLIKALEKLLKNV